VSVRTLGARARLGLNRWVCGRGPYLKRRKSNPNTPPTRVQRSGRRGRVAEAEGRWWWSRPRSPLDRRRREKAQIKDHRRRKSISTAKRRGLLAHAGQAVSWKAGQAAARRRVTPATARVQMEKGARQGNEGGASPSVNPGKRREFALDPDADQQRRKVWTSPEADGPEAWKGDGQRVGARKARDAPAAKS